ncbi:MAG: DUF4249 family protein [Arcicella sp.]|nr:DUF4249 family protein [Arcicella sp.]
MRLIIGFLLITFLFTRCSRTSVVEGIIFPIPNQTLSVFCFLTPSDSIHAAIKEIRSVSNTNKEFGIENAEITIEDLNTKETIQLKHLSNGGYFGNSQTTFKVKPNHTYVLTVHSPDKITLRSSCTVPNQGAVIENFTFGDPFDDGFISKRRRIEASWQDVSTETQKLNYLISSGGKFKDSFTGKTVEAQPSLKSFKNISQSGTSLFYNSDTTDDTFPKFYYLHTLEYNLYQFEKMAQLMDEISKKSTSSFLGAYQGIIPEFTNIQNGYGIFGAYLTTSLTVTIK